MEPPMPSVPRILRYVDPKYRRKTNQETLWAVSITSFSWASETDNPPSAKTQSSPFLHSIVTLWHFDHPQYFTILILNTLFITDNSPFSYSYFLFSSLCNVLSRVLSAPWFSVLRPFDHIHAIPYYGSLPLSHCTSFLITQFQNYERLPHDQKHPAHHPVTHSFTHSSM